MEFFHESKLKSICRFTVSTCTFSGVTLTQTAQLEILRNLVADKAVLTDERRGERYAITWREVVDAEELLCLLSISTDSMVIMTVFGNSIESAKHHLLQFLADAHLYVVPSKPRYTVAELEEALLEALGLKAPTPRQ